MRRRSLAALGIASVLLLEVSARAEPAGGWTGSWASAQQGPGPNKALTPGDLGAAPVRRVVHLSLGGPAVRVRLANDFGTQPLTFTAVHVAQARAPGSAAIV